MAVSAPVARLRATPLRLLGDERLAKLAAAGDRPAFTAIYDRYHAPLYRYCLSLLGDPEDARDALQTTLLAAMRGLERRPLDGALRPWLYRIAHNASISIVRRRRAQTELDERELPAADSPERAVAARERLGALLRDLHSLTARQRSALLLRELSGLPYDEIAATFAITPAAARQAVFDARSALTQLAAGHDDDCATIRRSISDGDRRVLRARRVRGHLGECESCRAFEAGVRSRRRVLALIPAPPAALAAAVLPGLLGGGAAAPVFLKGAAIAAGLAVAGLGTVDAERLLRPRHPHAHPTPVVEAKHDKRVVAAAPIALRRPARRPAVSRATTPPRARSRAVAVIRVRRASTGSAPSRAARGWRPAPARTKPVASAPTPPSPPAAPPPAATTSTTSTTSTSTNPVSAALTAAHDAVSQAQALAHAELAAAQQQASQALAQARQQVQQATQGLSTLLDRLRRGGR